METQTQNCALCQRSVASKLITQHHLVPRQKGGKVEHKVPLCQPCHKQIHAVFGNTELAKVFNSIEQLRESAQLQSFLKWIRRQKPHQVFRTDISNRHPMRKRR